MTLSKFAFFLIAGGLLFGLQVTTAHGQSSNLPSLLSAVSPPVAVATPSGNSSAASANPAAYNLMRHDLYPIHRDRENIRSDHENIARSRQDIRAAEYDMTVNPQNAAADEARIANDRNSIHNDRNDIAVNRRRIHHDERILMGASLPALSSTPTAPAHHPEATSHVAGSNGSANSSRLIFSANQNGSSSQNAVRRDLNEIHHDRQNLRSDRENVASSRHDIRAAEHDMQINPKNKSADESRIANDEKSIRNDRQDIARNRQQIHHAQQNLQDNRAPHAAMPVRHAAGGNSASSGLSNEFVHPHHPQQAGQQHHAGHHAR